MPNKFSYQGHYSEEEEESGYDEFALRTYDPTIGRWLSTDPYDEFASPYLAMGNDPVNNVDPDGGSIGGWVRPFLQTLNIVRTPIPMAAIGQFSGVAQPTSLSGSTAAGTSGGGSTSGGLLNSLGNAAANALGQWVANKLLPMPSGPDARQLQSCSGGASSGSSGGSQRPSTPSQPVPQSSGCNCPPGYGPTPKNPGDKPLFLDPDDVALEWAYRARLGGMNGVIEYSSQIFALEVSNGVGTSKTTLYGYTSFVHNPPTTDAEHDPHTRSPPPYSPLHGPKPSNSTIVGHIHLHPAVTKFSDEFNQNNAFSDGDRGVIDKFPKLIFYVFGALGNLYGRYPKVMPPLKDGWPDQTRTGQTELPVPGGQGMFKPGVTWPSVCRCYKQ